MDGRPTKPYWYLSGTVGDVPAVLMVIRLDDAPPPSPCEFR
ncbi:MAG: hypothetical protein ABI192_18820 [Bradyrhizobium sp.]